MLDETAVAVGHASIGAPGNDGTACTSSEWRRRSAARPREQGSAARTRGGRHEADTAPTLPAVRVRSRSRARGDPDDATSGRESRRTRRAREVRPAGTAPGRGHRRGHPERTRPILVQANRDHPTTASRPAADTAVGVRRWLGARWSGRFVRNGDRGANRQTPDRGLHPRVARDLPQLDPGRHAADATRRRGAAHDPLPRRFRRGRQRRQPRGDAQRVRRRRNPDRLLHEPTASDAGLTPVVPRPRPGHDAPQCLCGARRRLHPPGRVRHRIRAQPDRNPRRRIRDPAGRPGPPVQLRWDVPLPDQRHPRRDLDRRVLRRHDARQRQGLALPGRRAPHVPIPHPERMQRGGS